MLIKEMQKHIEKQFMERNMTMQKLLPEQNMLIQKPFHNEDTLGKNKI